MNWRMLGPVDQRFSPMNANGRSYTAAAGQAIDVPDFDGQILQANGWVYVAPSGPTAARPTGALGLYPAVRGQRYFDTTLGLMIEHDGATWRTPTGAAV